LDTTDRAGLEQILKISAQVEIVFGRYQSNDAYLELVDLILFIRRLFLAGPSLQDYAAQLSRTPAAGLSMFNQAWRISAGSAPIHLPANKRFQLSKRISVDAQLQPDGSLELITDYGRHTLTWQDLQELAASANPYITLGSAEDNTIKLADKFVSPNHAGLKVVIDEGNLQIWLEDLNSDAGTYLEEGEGVRSISIRVTEPVLLIQSRQVSEASIGLEPAEMQSGPAAEADGGIMPVAKTLTVLLLDTAFRFLGIWRLLSAVIAALQQTRFLGRQLSGLAPPATRAVQTQWANWLYDKAIAFYLENRLIVMLAVAIIPILLDHRIIISILLSHGIFLPQLLLTSDRLAWVIFPLLHLIPTLSDGRLSFVSRRNLFISIIISMVGMIWCVSPLAWQGLLLHLGANLTAPLVKRFFSRLLAARALSSQMAKKSIWVNNWPWLQVFFVQMGINPVLYERWVAWLAQTGLSLSAGLYLAAVLVAVHVVSPDIFWQSGYMAAWPVFIGLNFIRSKNTRASKIAYLISLLIVIVNALLIIMPFSLPVIFAMPFIAPLVLSLTAAFLHKARRVIVFAGLLFTAGLMLAGNLWILNNRVHYYIMPIEARYQAHLFQIDKQYRPEMADFDPPKETHILAEAAGNHRTWQGELPFSLSWMIKKPGKSNGWSGWSGLINWNGS
jgi:hypothetical protein